MDTTRAGRRASARGAAWATAPHGGGRSEWRNGDAYETRRQRWRRARDGRTETDRHSDESGVDDNDDSDGDGHDDHANGRDAPPSASGSDISDNERDAVDAHEERLHKDDRRRATADAWPDPRVDKDDRYRRRRGSLRRGGHRADAGAHRRRERRRDDTPTLPSRRRHRERRPQVPSHALAHASHSSTPTSTASRDAASLRGRDDHARTATVPDASGRRSTTSDGGDDTVAADPLDAKLDAIRTQIATLTQHMGAQERATRAAASSVDGDAPSRCATGSDGTIAEGVARRQCDAWQRKRASDAPSSSSPPPPPMSPSAGESADVSTTTPATTALFDPRLARALDEIRAEMQHLRAGASQRDGSTATVSASPPVPAHETRTPPRPHPEHRDDATSRDDGADDARHGRVGRRVAGPYGSDPRERGHRDRDGDGTADRIDRSAADDRRSATGADPDGGCADNPDELARTMRDIATERLASLLGYARTLIARVPRESPVAQRLDAAVRALEAEASTGGAALVARDGGVDEAAIGRLRATLARATEAM